MEKCLGRSGNGTAEAADLFAGGGEGMGKEGVASDEVASAVAAVSDEIGDILKDELGDADRADRIGAELADLSAELGLLAGLADGEPQQDFPSLFEIAMGHRGSGSGSSSSSWSGGRGGRQRRHSRPQRAPRRRPIAKGKEISRRRSAAARRAVCMRVRRVEVVSDASDVGADSDSDDQWTELDDASGSSDSSSMKEAVAVADMDCNGYQHKASVEAPAMGQFLLPLLSAEAPTPDPEHFLIRHEDILQLLASTEEMRDDIPLDDDAPFEQTDMCSDMMDCEDTPVSPEEEAALLHYVCEAERMSCEGDTPQFTPVQEWLLGVFHSWCEISALMFTLIGTNMSVEMVTEEWVYRARFGCHCRACLCLANSAEALGAFVRDVVWALAHCTQTVGTAARIVRALGTAPQDHVQRWDLPRLRRALRPAQHQGAVIIHEQLCKLAQQNEMAEQIVTKICLCREFDRPMEPEYAVERFCKILENFKAASTITLKVEMIPVCSRPGGGWVEAARARLARYLRPHLRASTAARLRDMAARTTPHDLSAWSGYKHKCDCLTPRTLCAQQRKQLLRISFFGMMQAVNEFNGAKPGTAADGDKPPNEMEPEASRELQQGDGTGAKPPEEVHESGDSAESATGDSGDSGDSERSRPHHTRRPHSNPDDLDDLSDSDAASGTASLGLSTSSSLDSASELLLAAAAGAGSGGSESGGSGSGGSAPGELCRTVRHLMRSIASIERLMDRVLKHCDDWPAPPTRNDQEARKRVDMGLSEVDRKLMAMYRRLPEVHRRQLQVYKKQKKLSTVCMQLVGGRAPAPPPPGSPPPAAPPQPCRALCPEYHLQRFKEVRRKVMHMRDQQLYYHRLRMWLEDQLRQERESLPDSNVTLIEELPGRKRRTSSPKVPRLTTAPKRKLKPASPSISKPHKILQMLKHKAPAQTTQLLTDDIKNDDDLTKSEAEPPEAFPLEREENISDAETIVLDKDTDLCKEMNECLAKFSNFALSNDTPEVETKYPESVSPPLQEMSPTTPEPMPVYSSKPNQRLLSVNKFLKEESEFTTAPEVLNIPLNARRTPLLVKEDKLDTQEKEPNIYKYVSFGLEIKKAMEECQNIINSYNSIKENKKDDGQLSLEHICEIMMTLDKNSAEFIDKMDTDDNIDMNAANSKLAELVENMPQILANMPEIASKLSEFANASFELPEFASIMNSLPDVNNEAQLTPETLKQIRELKLNKTRDSVKVTKNTTKRKTQRKIKNNIETNDLIGTMTFEFDNKDIVELLKDEKDLQSLVKNKNKEDFKDLLFSISAQVIINKVFEYLKQNKSPELAKCLEDDKELFSLPCLNTEMCTKASTLFDNSVKDALSMDDLRDLVKQRFNTWKHYVATKFKSIPFELLENEIEAMLDKFYSYIQDLAGKNHAHDSDRIVQKIDDLKKNSDFNRDSDSDSKDSVKQMLLTTSAGHTLDILLMKYQKLTQDKKLLAKGLKFKYTNVLARCVDSQPLANWLMTDPELAVNTIQEMMGFEVKRVENVPEFSNMNLEKKRDYFLLRIKDINKQYMETLPKKALSGDEWLVMLYKLEQYEVKLKEALSKLAPTVKTTQNASEAEILAAKGLSKIIGKASIRVVKKTEPPKKKEEAPKEIKEDDKRCKNDALLAKCEAILTTKGEKSLLDSFYTIKSYITQGLPVPETYKKHVISICSSIDAKLLDEDLEDSLRSDKDDSPGTPDSGKEKPILSQNHEDLAKYSAQALRNAKQTLNAVAFKNISRNGQSKSESDVCDTPKTDCKWTNDCSCNSCKDSDITALCLSSNITNIVQKCIEFDKKDRKERREGKKLAAKPKPVPKACENGNHQQHICKVGHGANACAGEGADQPCTCCYCTVFGHAPPLTTPVPPKFNETRERLRSILNKKKQQCKTANVEPEPQPVKQAVAQPQVAEPPAPKPQVKPPPIAPKPPALPKTQPPSLTPAQVQQKRQSMDNQQRQLADKMAKMAVTDKTVDNKPKVLQRTVPLQVNVTALKTEGKVNPNAMEQIRLQHLKQAQQAQYQQQLQQQQAQQQKKPEPIYDLPIHNKPTLTPQQQQQIRQQQQLRQQHQQILQQKLQHQQQQVTQQQVQQQVVQHSQQQAVQHAQQQAAQHAQQQAAQQQLAQQQLNQQQLTQQQLAQQQLAQQQLAQQQLAQQQLAQQQLTQQQINQQQLNQQQLAQQQHVQQLQAQQQQQAQQQRQSRPQQQRSTVSMSSRDTSVFSTSSGCSGGSCWRDRPEDTRDLDALLQYIEGPSRHIDRGKKRAKKQRQKAKKMEVRLMEEHERLSRELSHARVEMWQMVAANKTAELRVRRTRKLLDAHNKGKKKGKSQKVNPDHQEKVQLAEQLRELTMFMNHTTKGKEAAEKQVMELTRRMQQCERQLAEARAVQGDTQSERQQEAIQQEQLRQQQVQEQFEQEQMKQQRIEDERAEQVRQMQLIKLEKAKRKIEQDRAAATFMKAAQTGNIVCVRRSPGDGAVTLSIPGKDEEPLAELLHYKTRISTATIMHSKEEKKQQANNVRKPQTETRKQTWEQAVAHINQLAKGPNKDKKKQKEAQAKAEQKAKEAQRSNSLQEGQTISKKQRKLLARQQAEEEEKKKQQQAESKNKTESNSKAESKKLSEQKQDSKTKNDKEPDQVKKETAKRKDDKKEETKEKVLEKKDKTVDKKEKISEKKEKVSDKKEKVVEKKDKAAEKKEKVAEKKEKAAEKKEEKKEKAVEKRSEKKSKENKQEKTVSAPQPKPPKQSTQPPAQQFDSTKIVNAAEPEKPACSIMEQLSCGVQVADLKLPPGITLTRVQPCEKKEPPPIKSVPLWKCNQLPATPTPVPRPTPVINADPSMMMFTTAQPEPPPKPIPMPEPSQPIGKSKKAKKKAKKAAAAAEVVDSKPEGAKMVTLRNPMFHPNLPPVQITNQPPPPPKKQEQIRIPDPIPMPPNACQATITPTSNGMYTIRNPLMTMMHQQGLMGIRNQSPQLNPMYGSQYNYVNPNVYNPVQNPNQYVLEPSRNSPKQDDIQTRIMNLASFTQKNDEGYSLFKTSDDNQQRNFLTPDYYENQSPKPVVSPNPIGTRPTEPRFESNDSSLFANPIQRPEPIGTPLKKDEDRNDYTGLYTPFGQEDRNVFRNALFSDKNDCQSVRCDDIGMNPMCNGDSLPYFQRLRVGSKLNNEVTIHHVTESKFYKTPESGHPDCQDESLFSRQPLHGWPDQLYNPTVGNKIGMDSDRNSPVGSSLRSSTGAVGVASDERCFGPIGARPQQPRHTGTIYEKVTRALH